MNRWKKADEAAGWKVGTMCPARRIVTKEKSRSGCDGTEYVVTYPAGARDLPSMYHGRHAAFSLRWPAFSTAPWQAEREPDTIHVSATRTWQQGQGIRFGQGGDAYCR